MLNIRWIILARLPFAVAPMALKSAVTQVPMLLPIMTKSTLLPPLPMVIPAAAIEMTILVTAPLLWKRAVTAAPIRRSRMGLVTLVIAVWKNGSSLKISILPSIIHMPTKISPRPPRARPSVLNFSRLANRFINAPTQARSMR